MMKISKSKLKEIIQEELQPVLGENWQEWADRVGWSPPSHLQEFPEGRAGELLDLFYGDLSFEGSRKMERRLKRARKAAANATREDQKLSTSAYHFSKGALRARDKAKKEKEMRKPGWEDRVADELEAAADYERAAKRKEAEVEAHADETQEFFDILDIYDSLRQEETHTLQVAEDMLKRHGAEAMASLAINPNLTRELIDRVTALGTDRAREIMRTGVLPDKWE